MNKIYVLIAFVLVFSVNFANAEDLQACPHSKETEGSKDYLEASEAEIALLGKQSFHANIAMLEKALQERGAKLPQNGFITSEFRAALIAFQESLGLEAKGEINKETLDKLNLKF